MVCLPTLKEVRIYSHPIYQTDICWSISSGINFVIGANGLGKTTFLNCIHYGITGNTDIHDQFEKLSKQRKHKDEIKIVVVFTVDNIEVTIERKVPHGAPCLVIKDGEVSEKHSDPTTVNEKIAKLVGVDHINDLDFLLEKFLIRQEEANHVLWSSDVQSKVLQILFRTSEFREKYNSLRKVHGEYHTQHNQKRYHASKLKSDIEKITQEVEILSDKLREKGLDIENENIINDLNKEQQRYDKLAKLIDDIQLEIYELNKNIEIILSEMETVEQEREELQAKIENIEGQIYSEVYSLDPVNIMAYDELVRLNHCVFCDTHLKQEVVEKIIAKTKNHCFFCGSEYPKQRNDNLPNVQETDIQRYKTLESNRRHLEMQERKLREEKHRLNEELRKLSRELSDSEVKLEKYKYQLDYLPKELKEISKQLDALQLRKDVLEEQWLIAKKEQAELEQLRDEAEQQLLQLEEENRIALEEIADDLGSEIQKLAHFMGLNVSLVTEKVAHEVEKRIDVHIFVPIVDDIPRNRSDQLSKSQSILLDYAFRMALINYYLKRNSENKGGMFLLETSEGSFDAAYVKWLAEALIEFSTNNISFIVVANLSNKEFLKSIYKNINTSDRKSRTLNVFQHGQLREAHIKGREDYAEIWKDLFGTESVF
jgi:DNA repair exonuclease SbcCD ATPase subunit